MRALFQSLRCGAFEAIIAAADAMLGAGPRVILAIAMAALAIGASCPVLAAGGRGPADRSHPALAQRLVLPPVIDIEPPEMTDLLWFVVASGEDGPQATDLLIKGVPPGVAFSAGRAQAGGGWLAPLSAIESLKVQVPPGFSGTLDLEVALVDLNGAVLDHHAAELRVKAAAVASPAAPASPVAPEGRAAPPWHEATTIGTTAPRHHEPLLVIAPVIDVEAAVASWLPFGVAGRPDDAPPGTTVRVRGLPRGVTLSEGRPEDGRGWVVPLSAIQDVEITVPPSLAGKLDVEVALVDGDGGVIEEHPAELWVKPAAATVARVPAAEGVPPEQATVTAAVPAPAPVVAPAADAAKPAAVAPPSRAEAEAASPHEAALRPEAAPAHDAVPPPEAATPHEAAATPAALPQVKPAVVAALVVAPALDAEIAAPSRFPIEVREGPEGLPPGTHVLVIGLPAGVTLSGGQLDASRGWVVPLSALDNLKINVPSGMAGNLDVGLALIDNEGTVLAQRGATIRLSPKVAAVPGDTAPGAAPRNKTTAKGAALAEARRLAELAERSLARGHVAEAREYFARAIDLGLPIAHPWDGEYGQYGHRHGRGR